MTHVISITPARAFWLLSIATVVFALSTTRASSFHTAFADIAAEIPTAVMANIVLACVAWAAGTATLAGAMTGTLLGIVIFAGAGWPGWWLLVTGFAIAAGATRLGGERKSSRGIAEGRGGRRGAGNAWANLGVSAIAALAIRGGAPEALAIIAMVAALVTAISDTVGTEVGSAYGRRTWLITTGRRVPPGTTGAVSVEGTVAGAGAAAALTALAWGLGIIDMAAVGPVSVIAIGASLVEGLVAPAFERRGVIDNNGVNFVNALLGAGGAIGWQLLRQ